MRNREDFLPLSPLSFSLSLSFIITWSFQEALIFLQLILMWIRDNKQPINGALNWEMELESAAEFRGWLRLITPLLQRCAEPPDEQDVGLILLLINWANRTRVTLPYCRHLRVYQTWAGIHITAGVLHGAFGFWKKDRSSNYNIQTYLFTVCLDSVFYHFKQNVQYSPWTFTLLYVVAVFCIITRMDIDSPIRQC